ncbi:MAG TPA: cytochrome c oxidase subunit II [Streptosporangiaceae bacterium]|jgi:cytochrome c oxidase subunit 2|nr:cytochrome c oxidase subunit II [Streptosporangiaceae bacterium]
MAAQTPAATGTAAEPRHGLRIFLIWLVAAAIADPLIWFVWGPHMPPGDMASAAASQQFDINVMAVMAAPVMLFVLIYSGYALIVWRYREGDEEDGPPIHGNVRIQVSWIAATAAIVLGLFGFGTYELIAPAGAGAGEGPSPIWKPTGSTLQVQVIGQQWRFTYRYPQFGGFETTQLVLPVGQNVAFNVTSIDVIHSFWAYQLGVKADANPNVDNVAYTKPEHTGTFTVRCAELCGLWHGAMFDTGQVMPVPAFQAWARSTETRLAAVTRMLPPYALTYDPTVIPTINAAMAKAGITGANGYYYPPQDPVQP